MQLCREGARQIIEAAEGKNVRLVAIAKERDGHEEFTRGYWPAEIAEIYFDTFQEGYQYFKATNGTNANLVTSALSLICGCGEVARNNRRAKQAGFGGHCCGINDSDSLITRLSDQEHALQTFILQPTQSRGYVLSHFVSHLVILRRTAV